MADAKVKKKQYIFLSVRIAVVVGGIIWAIIWVSREQRWQSLVELFGKINGWVFVGVLGVFVGGQVIVGFRWWLLLRTQSIFINIFAAVRLHFLGLFYNNVMPSSVGGDLIRAWYVTRHTEKKFAAVLSVFVDRLVGLLSTLVIAVFFYLLFLRGRGAVITSSEEGGFFERVSEYRGIIFWVLLAIVLLFGGLLIHRRGRAMLVKGWLSISLHGMRVIRKLKDAVVLYCSKPMTILAVFGLTIFLQIMTITGFWFLGRNMGIEASIKYYYVFFTLTWVLGAIPVSIGGVVVVEGLLVLLFTQFAGVRTNLAVALALCQRIVWLLASLPGAVIHLVGAHLPKDFFVDYDSSVD
ncbi:MAG: lysylphosphatidylglycerol synthase transmembrane domain-containing protein [Planctomycetota bacterium]|jgi:uncharacterized protein (TIRG00374 family)